MGTPGGTITIMKTYDDYIMFIDYLVNCISNGKYIYYQTSYIPEGKLENEDFIINLERKIKSKYKTDLNRAKRQTLLRNGKARHLAARYKNILVILKTQGDTEVAPTDKWVNILKNKLEIKLGKHTTYVIGAGPTKKKKSKNSLDFTVTVTLGADTLNLIKINCIDAISYQKDVHKLIYEWNKINGFNGWSGINKQKQQLKQYLIGEVCKHLGFKRDKASKLFRVNTYKAKTIKTLELEQLSHLAIEALGST